MDDMKMLSVNIPEDLFEEIQSEAKERGMKKYALVEDLLLRGLYSLRHTATAGARKFKR